MTDDKLMSFSNQTPTEVQCAGCHWQGLSSDLVLRGDDLGCRYWPLMTRCTAKGAIGPKQKGPPPFSGDCAFAALARILTLHLRSIAHCGDSDWGGG